MKNTKEELLELINQLDDKSTKKHQALIEYCELLNLKTKNKDFENVIGQLPYMIKAIKGLDIASKGRVSTDAFFDNMNQIQNIKRVINTLTDSISSSTIVHLIPSDNNIVKKIALQLKSTDGILSSINRKLKNALPRGKTELAHKLIETSNDYLGELEKVTDMLNKENLEMFQQGFGTKFDLEKHKDKSEKQSKELNKKTEETNVDSADDKKEEAK